MSSNHLSENIKIIKNYKNRVVTDNPNNKLRIAVDSDILRALSLIYLDMCGGEITFDRNGKETSVSLDHIKKFEKERLPYYYVNSEFREMLEFILKCCVEHEIELNVTSTPCSETFHRDEVYYFVSSLLAHKDKNGNERGLIHFTDPNKVQSREYKRFVYALANELCDKDYWKAIGRPKGFTPVSTTSYIYKNDNFEFDENGLVNIPDAQTLIPNDAIVFAESAAEGALLLTGNTIDFLKSKRASEKESDIQENLRDLTKKFGLGHIIKGLPNHPEGTSPAPINMEQLIKFITFMKKHPQM